MIELYCGDCLQILRTLPDGIVQCCVTSPPYYGLRDYKVDGQIGLEESPEAYVTKLVEVFREVMRVLRDDGVLYLNLGDSYTSSGIKTGTVNNSSSTLQCGKLTQANAASVCGKFIYDTKPKDLIGIPWRVAFALQADGWYLRSDIIWHKPNPMPESVTDRCTKSHEYIFMLTKSARYYWDAEAVKEPFADDRNGNPGTYKWNYGDAVGKGKGESSLLKQDGMVRGWNTDGKHSGRNLRDVWTITTKPYKEAHFATFPPEIPERCIKAGTSERGCCPKCGAPWERVVEKETHNTRPGTLSKYTDDIPAVSRKYRTETNTTTTGWQPTCSCDAGSPVPCTVLDPFSGAGTTGVVAVKLGRSYIGIELNPEYIEMTKRRLDTVQPLLEVA